MRSELTYKGIEIDDEQYNAEFKIEDMDKALSNYDGTTTQQNLIGGEF